MTHEELHQACADEATALRLVLLDPEGQRLLTLHPTLESIYDCGVRAGILGAVTALSARFDLVPKGES
jgi:hypothetical protein